MKKKDLQIGQLVEVRGFPFTGRVGRVRKVGRYLVELWCDEPDGLGRHVVRTRAKELRSVELDGATR